MYIIYNYIYTYICIYAHTESKEKHGHEEHAIQNGVTSNGGRRTWPGEEQTELHCFPRGSQSPLEEIWPYNPSLTLGHLSGLTSCHLLSHAFSFSAVFSCGYWMVRWFLLLLRLWTCFMSLPYSGLTLQMSVKCHFPCEAHSLSRS